MKPSYSKAGNVTKRKLSTGNKQVKEEFLRINQPSNLGPAPAMRIYSRDYSKRDPDGDQKTDTLSAFLGNPLDL